MNKIIPILAGVALAAAVATPASAGIFAPLGNSAPVFAFTPPGMSGYTLTAAPVTYYTGFGQGAVGTAGTLNITGTNLLAGSTYTYLNSTLNFSPTQSGTDFSPAFTETGATSVALVNGGTFISGAGLSRGDFLNLNYAPVPEASTVVSFGALLALGGVALLRRKSVARAS